ncbi:MAG TPA: arginine N-succinyltransferase, partial [Verrucomicrobiales bacterium]|nr:arginine N-succinyltransferase [Verrucomicrobiales bacterium]
KKVALEVSDVRVGGLPMPNAWLGNIKGVNLAAENLEKDPALQRFLAGIQSLKITSEGLRIVLAE